MKENSAPYFSKVLHENVFEFLPVQAIG